MGGVVTAKLFYDRIKNLKSEMELTKLVRAILK
jgi:hypothetical protein